MSKGGGELWTKMLCCRKIFAIITVTLCVGNTTDKKLCTSDNVVNMWPSTVDKDIVLQKILYA